MVGTLTRLQLRLLRREFQGSAGRIIAMIVGLLYLAGLLVFVWNGAVSLRGTHDATLISTISIAVLGLVTLCWPLFILVMFGSDATLDPGRFALLPVRSNTLMPGLLIAGFVSLGGATLLLLAGAFVLAWSFVPLMGCFALIGAVIGAVTCELAGRAFAAALGGLMSNRKSRDATAVITYAVILVIAVGINMGSRHLFDGEGMGWGADKLGLVTTAAKVMAWTPFGWAWALPTDAAAGAWGALAARLVASLALLAGLWVWWRRSLDTALTSPLTASGGGEEVKGSGRLAGRLPDTPAGAIAWRSLLYWRRDSRHVIQMLAALVVPGFVVASTFSQSHSMGDARPVVIVAPVVLAIFVYVLIMSEISYDGSALWHEIVSGTRGRDDRWGRALAVLIVFVPIDALLVVVLAAWLRAWQWAPLAMLCGLGFMGLSTAVGSVAGSLWQQSVPPAGANPFSKTQTGSIQTALGLFLGVIAMFVLAIPILVGVVVPLAVAGGSAGLPLATALAALGVLYGGVIAALGVRWGGKLLDAKWPETLKTISSE